MRAFESPRGRQPSGEFNIGREGERGVTALGARYAAATAGGNPVVLEGLHAVKHALRFGAEVTDLVTADLDGLLALAAEVAPEAVVRLRRSVTVIGVANFQSLHRRPPATPLLGLGPVFRASAEDVFNDGDAGPVVMLEDPRHAGNVGAAVRVVAAAGAAGVLTSGSLDPWSAAAVRGSAGLHYALAVGTVADAGLMTDRQVVALDPDGSPFDPNEVAVDAVLVFGGERHGLSDAAREQADLVRRLPMRPGVSSLNLATAVAATLFQLDIDVRT